MIRRINTLNNELEALRSNGIQRGDNTGFSTLDSIYSLKQGSYTIVLGEPGHGKSEFIFELLINQSVAYGKVWLIYSPETGSVVEIIAELVHKITGKSMLKTGFQPCTDKEYYDALAWIEGHFLIVDSDDKAFSLNELYTLTSEFEKENETIKIAGIMADPYNELRHDMKDSRQDLYIEELLGEMRRFCKKNKKHVILSVHPQEQKGQLVVKEGKTFYLKPLPRQAAGGQALFRKAMSWVTLWRPPTNIDMGDGTVYEENTVLVSIDKAKPKGVSFKGTVVMGFDWKLNRYYEVIDGVKFYAFERDKYLKNGTVPQNLTFDI